MWMLSLGQNLLTLRNTAGWQLYFIMTPARVSAGPTLCTYTNASSSYAGDADIFESESLRFNRPVLSVCSCTLARRNASLFLAWTIACLSSCVPAARRAVASILGPHCGVD